MCWLRLGLAGECAWTSLGLLPSVSREEVGKEGAWFWLPLCTTLPALMRSGHGGGSAVCSAFATLLQAVQRRCPRGADGFSACLVFGFLVHGAVPARFLFASEKSLD